MILPGLKSSRIAEVFDLPGNPLRIPPFPQIFYPPFPPCFRFYGFDFCFLMRAQQKGRPRKSRTPWSDSSSRYEGGFFSSRLRCSSSSFFFSSGVFGRGGALRASGSPRGGGGSALRLSGGGSALRLSGGGGGG